MNSSDSKFIVEHETQKQCFFINFHDDNKAVLNYEWVKSGTVDLYHTEVPSVHRGKGVAQVLAKAAFDFVVKENIGMILSCTYLQKYLSEHPLKEYKTRVVDK